MNRNARITQNQEMASRIARLFQNERFPSASSRASAWDRDSTSAFTLCLHFELHQISRIDAGVTGGAELPIAIVHGFAEAFQRKIAERVGFEVFTNFFHG